MIVESKKYKIVIGGQSYTIVSDEPEATLMQAVALLDSAVHDVIRACPTVEHSKCIMLAALTMATNLIATRTAQEKLLKRIERDVFETPST